MWPARRGVETVARGGNGTTATSAPAALFATDAETFLANHSLENEVFGAAALVVRCPDLATMRRVMQRTEGQLTVTLQMDAGDTDDARTLLPVLERRCGRILVNGWPTGVEVGHAMVHGGPFPVHVGCSHDVGRHFGDKAFPTPGLLPGHAGRAVAAGSEAR